MLGTVSQVFNDWGFIKLKTAKQLKKMRVNGKLTDVTPSVLTADDKLYSAVQPKSYKRNDKFKSPTKFLN